MADHGSIATFKGMGRRALAVLHWSVEPVGAVVKGVVGEGRRVIPSWAQSPTRPTLIAIDVTGTFSGVVTEDGVPTPFTWVALYYRPTHVLLARTRTDANGAFSFQNLDKSDLEGYFAVAFDADGGVNFNAKILDKLSAV